MTDMKHAKEWLECAQNNYDAAVVLKAALGLGF